MSLTGAELDFTTPYKTKDPETGNDFYLGKLILREKSYNADMQMTSQYPNQFAFEIMPNNVTTVKGVLNLYRTIQNSNNVKMYDPDYSRTPEMNNLTSVAETPVVVSGGKKQIKKKSRKTKSTRRKTKSTRRKTKSMRRKSNRRR